MPEPAKLLDQVRAEIRRRAADAERRALATDAERIRGRCQTLAGFVREAWHVLEPNATLVWNWHLDAICDHLEAITAGRINRLLVNVPPGSSKSLLASVLWQAWEWGPKGRHSLRYLTTAFNDTPVTRDTRKCRDLILSDWYRSLWPEVVLVRTAETSFANGGTGSREGVAFGSLTSQRGDRLIIDDPHSTETAESPAERERTSRKFREGATNRLNDQERSAIVVIMQRLHEGDISGVIKRLGMEYVHLCLPMEFEVERACSTPLFTDPRTYDGELLDPVRFPRETVAKLKRDMGPYAYAGQYQQRPAPREGGLFDIGKIEVVDALPPISKTVRAWDLAGSKKRPGSSPDWTVGLKMVRGSDKAFYIVDVRRFQETPGKVRQTLMNTASQDGADTYIRMPQDPGQAGKAQAEDFVTALAGFMVKAVPPTGAKEIRAKPFASQVEVGNVKLLRGTWNDTFLEELGMFPSGAHDDQVDAAADAFNELAGIAPGEGIIEFYRRENAAQPAVTGPQFGWSMPTGQVDGKTPMRAPPGTGTVIGMSGAHYAPDADGRVRVAAEDAGPLRAAGFVDAAEEVA